MVLDGCLKILGRPPQRLTTPALCPTKGGEDGGVR